MARYWWAKSHSLHWTLNYLWCKKLGTFLLCRKPNFFVVEWVPLEFINWGWLGCYGMCLGSFTEYYKVTFGTTARPQYCTIPSQHSKPRRLLYYGAVVFEGLWYSIFYPFPIKDDLQGLHFKERNYAICGDPTVPLLPCSIQFLYSQWPVWTTRFSSSTFHYTAVQTQILCKFSSAKSR